jgi:hypothetical protein
MRRNFNNLVCLETLLSFISDNELLTYLSENSLAYGDNLLHIAGKNIFYYTILFSKNRLMRYAIQGHLCIILYLG